MHIHYLVWKHAVNILIKIIPSLSYNLHKGQLGRIGVIGGSRDYCGAPYYCGESTLKFGADLCTIYCSYDALIPIKSYSPELMVTPFYKLQGNSKNNINNNSNNNNSNNNNSNNNNSNNNSNNGIFEYFEYNSNETVTFDNNRSWFGETSSSRCIYQGCYSCSYCSRYKVDNIYIISVISDIYFIYIYMLTNISPISISAPIPITP